MSQIVADYYARSMFNTPPDKDYTGFHGWVTAMWQNPAGELCKIHG